MNPEEYAAYDGLGLAELVRDGEASRLELVEAAIDIAERRNPALNAICHTAYEHARETARARDDQGAPGGVFDGVPFLLKDLFGEIQGWPERRGTRAMADYVSPSTGDLTARQLDTGLIPIGKTTTPEFGLIAVTESEAYGDTRNPWSLDHTPGASSGGSAAAVAAGIVPIAHANDGGGSIRIPASCSGLVGMKPSRGRMPCGPFAELAGGLAAEHVVTQSVRDSAALMDATCAIDPGAPYIAPQFEGRYLDAVTSSPGNLRIAFWTKYWIEDIPTHPECVAAVESAVQVLGELGHSLEEARPSLNYAHAMESFNMVWNSMAAASVDALTDSPSDEHFEPYTLEMARQGRAVSGSEFLVAKERLFALGRKVAGFHQQYDVLVTTVLGTPPLRVGEWDRSRGTLEESLTGMRAFLLASPVANATGQPAISLPLHMTADGLPVGVMLTAAYGREDLLFQVAGQLEAACPWRDRRPPIWG